MGGAAEGVGKRCYEKRVGTVCIGVLRGRRGSVGHDWYIMILFHVYIYIGTWKGLLLFQISMARQGG